jgi:hypothetical protein
MVEGERYEVPNNEVLSALNFITDVRKAFPGVAIRKVDEDNMNSVASEILIHHNHVAADREEVFRIRRICAGMVLEAMGFIENGI